MPKLVVPLLIFVLGALGARTAVAAPSAKKGVGAWHFEGVDKAIADVQVSWFYTWRPSVDGVPVPAGAEFVPMIWGRKHVTPEALNTAKTTGHVLLGFNEPDHLDQSKLTVEQALDLWPQLMTTGLRLGSPATANDPRWAGSWLERFMDGAKRRGYRVDFVCVHRYVGAFEPATATAELKAFLEGVHKKFGLPIWLTEYALVRWNSPTEYATRSQQAAFAKQSMAMMETLPLVERYAWFAMPPSAAAPGLTASETVSLYDAKGRATLVGKAYRAAGQQLKRR